MRYEKRVLEALTSKGGEIVIVGGSGSAITRLARCLGMDWEGKEDELERNVESLARKGKVTFARRSGEGSPITSIAIVNKPSRTHSTRSTTAPDRVPVAMTTLIESEIAMSDNTTREPLHVRLTNALLALQINADPDGLVKANSLARVLMDELNVKQDTARDILKRLGSLGLKTTENLGGGKFIHHVRIDVTEVTEAMLAEERTKKVQSSVPKAPTKPAQPVTEESSPDTVPPTKQAEDVISALLSIIEQLETEKTELETDLARSAESLDRGLEVVQQLQAEKAELEAKVASQAAELAAKAAPAAKAAEVIARYRRSKS